MREIIDQNEVVKTIFVEASDEATRNKSCGSGYNNHGNLTFIGVQVTL
jgi:hypothetical protein